MPRWKALFQTIQVAVEREPEKDLRHGLFPASLLQDEDSSVESLEVGCAKLVAKAALEIYEYKDAISNDRKAAAERHSNAVATFTKTHLEEENFSIPHIDVTSLVPLVRSHPEKSETKMEFYNRVWRMYQLLKHYMLKLFMPRLFSKPFASAKIPPDQIPGWMRDKSADEALAEEASADEVRDAARYQPKDFSFRFSAVGSSHAVQTAHKLLEPGLFQERRWAMFDSRLMTDTTELVDAIVRQFNLSKHEHPGPLRVSYLSLVMDGEESECVDVFLLDFYDRK